MPSPLARRPARPDDLDALIELRLIAMRPSLEKLGRFNPARARQRFVDEFAPEHTTILIDEGRIVGCYALLPRADHFCLAHLYLLPAYQGRGIGRSIVMELQRKADQMGKQIHLIALSQSDAEHLYARLGFEIIDRDNVEVRMVYAATGDQR
ncbi:GNAT family N-acetyltransferase [Maritalea mediterranea]|uniref:GNAT family N-acetyltransferase n=1 Tax=Maritalea mediterranea TaxID=2909667 RepID=A0ABS9E4G5_9HYPH|nr:GNAT family N-acetyltransferase [Maritalea mediterranea]MCF4097763.1 GNAT family N-acetyltransferase [Maritalea mediterranea]